VGTLEALDKYGYEVVFATSKGRRPQPLLHEVGSRQMGIDDQAVVDPPLRVHGVTGLRVVDASAIPAMPSANCHAAIAAIAERAADLINEDDHR
jgi:choline dehydrogenase-like flavoprotein